jgi:hypothetical protein
VNGQKIQKPDDEQVQLLVHVPRWVHRGFKDVCAARGCSMRSVVEQFAKDVLSAYGVEKDNGSGNAGTEQ